MTTPEDRSAPSSGSGDPADLLAPLRELTLAQSHEASHFLVGYLSGCCPPDQVAEAIAAAVQHVNRFHPDPVV